MKMGGDGGRRVADGEAGVEAGEDGWWRLCVEEGEIGFICFVWFVFGSDLGSIRLVS